jgi:chromosomal replication initiation ATPase DnaA
MPVSDFTLKSRVRDVVELRFLGAYLLRQYYPGITLKQISILFGGQDHSSIINSIQRAVDMLQTKDEIFLYKYQTTQKAINEWLRKDVLALGSAASA